MSSANPNTNIYIYISHKLESPHAYVSTRYVSSLSCIVSSYCLPAYGRPLQFAVRLWVIGSSWIGESGPITTCHTGIICSTDDGRLACWRVRFRSLLVEQISVIACARLLAAANFLGTSSVGAKPQSNVLRTTTIGAIHRFETQHKAFPIRAN